MADDFTRSAVAAATEVVRRFGLPADSPEVLHEKSNVLVRLGSVVARVPATTRLLRTRPADALARDVALSRHVAARGVRVVSPTADPPPGPHFAGGLPVTLWHFTPHEPGYRFAPGEVARSLSELHTALRDYDGELPERGPLDEIGALLDSFADRMDGAAPRLRSELERLGEAVLGGPVQALHGDAHTGNVIATAGGPCWLDFEDSWRGPLGWDLATLAGQAGPTELAAYPGAPDAAALTAFGELRELFGVCWGYAIAHRFPARLDEAQQRLRRYLD